MLEKTIVAHLGHLPYRKAWDLQKKLQERLIAAKRANEDPLPPHLLLFVEHPPVYTLGTNGNAANLLVSESQLTERGSELIHIDRGGDITFHGPGQLVCYPILDLGRIFTDIHRYLRTLEEAVMLTCGDFGLDAGRVEHRTGVWVGPDEVGPERKLCAMGIRCSRWVTMHGLALNVNTDLSYFDLMIPCGIRNRGVTSLARELGRPVDEAEVRDRLTAHLLRALALEKVASAELADALALLDRYARAETKVGH